jgi:hypothetical protein
MMWKFTRSSSRWLGLFVPLAASFLLLQLIVQFKYADPDGYYHLKIATLIAQGKIGDNFPWLQFTTWNTGFADQHYLFHLLLIPFVYLKVVWLVIPAFSALMLSIFYCLLEKLEIKWKMFWLILAFFGSADFLFRINLIKANTLSLILLFVSLILLYRKRYVWLLPLSAIFVWTYGGFVFLPLIVGIWCVIDSIFHKRVIWQPLIFSSLGVICGIGLHPQASHLIPYLQTQIFQAGLGSNERVPVGMEWDAYNWWYFIKTNFIVIGIWLVTTFILFKNIKASNSRRQYSLFLAVMSAGFWALTLLHRRFIEYSVPFSLIYSAHVLSPHLRLISIERLKELCRQYWQFGVSLIVAIGCLSLVCYFNTDLVIHYFQFSKEKNTYRNAALWLNNNTASGDIIFNPQWDEFPQLFFWDDKNYYIVGMDPTFMYLHDKDLYWAWRKISDDNPAQWSNNNVTETIKNKFKAAYVFIEPARNPNLEKYLEKHNGFVQTYADPNMVIYKVE